MWTNVYDEGAPRWVWSDDYFGDAVFVRVCPSCNRYVKPDPVLHLKGESIVDVPNASCAKHGRIQMPFEGFF